MKVLESPFSNYEDKNFSYERKDGIDKIVLFCTGKPPIERTPKEKEDDTFYIRTEVEKTLWDSLSSEERIDFLKLRWERKVLEMLPVIEGDNQ